VVPGLAEPGVVSGQAEPEMVPGLHVLDVIVLVALDQGVFVQVDICYLVALG
jgi:hypothetical protein